MRLKCRRDWKYLANDILQCQLDIVQQLSIIWIILINKCITLAVFALEISYQTPFITIRIAVFLSKVRKFLNKLVSSFEMDPFDAFILQFLVFSKHFLNLFFSFNVTEMLPLKLQSFFSSLRTTSCKFAERL